MILFRCTNNFLNAKNQVKKCQIDSGFTGE